MRIIAEASGPSQRLCSRTNAVGVSMTVQYRSETGSGGDWRFCQGFRHEGDLVLGGGQLGLSTGELAAEIVQTAAQIVCPVSLIRSRPFGPNCASFGCSARFL